MVPVDCLAVLCSRDRNPACELAVNVRSWPFGKKKGNSCVRPLADLQREGMGVSNAAEAEAEVERAAAEVRS